LWAAYNAAKESPDPSTQNGAVIPLHHQDDVTINVIAHCNTFPDGVAVTPERLADRNTKLAYIEHAERNAILLAAKHGFALNGAIMYVPWFACDECGRAIIQAGIKKVVGHKQMFDKTPERWKASIAHAHAMLTEAGVEMELIDAKIDGPTLRFNGETWQP
jgi:deoxycytidylate deaminase